jgi:hypothetical protein
MKISSLFVVLSLMVSVDMLAQQQLPAEKKIAYGNDGRIFINKELGVYLWISNSPDENSKKIRLVSDSSVKYSNPMYFDTQGFNTFRSPSCVDTTTKRMLYPEQEIIFEVYADSKPPVTKPKILYNNERNLNNKIFYSGQVKIVLSGNDILSGVDKTYYSISGNPFNIYSDTLKITTEGDNSLKFYSCDKTGNIENVEQLKFTIDNTAPVSILENAPDKTIKLTASDNLSGVKAIFYQINNGPVKTYTVPILSKLIGKEGILTFWSVDNVNNAENKKSISSKETAN